MAFNPNICTPTMCEEELRALKRLYEDGLAFTDQQLSARQNAVIELRKAFAAVRDLPGWKGDSAGEAEALLVRMEQNAAKIETALTDLESNLTGATSYAVQAASDALGRLPSAKAQGFLADAGRNLSDVTDGWGAFDTGEAVAREEARLAEERETAAMKELQAIRSSLTGQAHNGFNPIDQQSIDSSDVPLPVIDVESIDRGIPAVGSNRPSSVSPPIGGGGGSIGGGGGGGVGTWPGGGGGGGGGGGIGTWPGGGGGGGGGVIPSGPDLPTNPGDGGGNPRVDSPGIGTLPGVGTWPGGGGGGGGGVTVPGGGGGLLPGGSGGGILGGIGAGGAGAASLLGARTAALGSAGGAGMFGGASGVGGAYGAGGSAAGAGRGLLAGGAAPGAGGLGSSGAAGAGGTGSGAAGARTAPGMMGGGMGQGDEDKRRERSGLGGPMAPKLEDDEETGPRSKGAMNGSRENYS